MMGYSIKFTSFAKFSVDVDVIDVQGYGVGEVSGLPKTEQERRADQMANHRSIPPAR